MSFPLSGNGLLPDANEQSGGSPLIPDPMHEGTISVSEETSHLLSQERLAVLCKAPALEI